MSQDEKKDPDLHGDQDEVGGTDRPPFAEQQQDTGEPSADIEEEGEGDGGKTDDG